MTTVTIHQAKTNLSKLIAQVADGGEVLICRDKVPVARLVKIETSPPLRQPGAWKDRPGYRIDESFLDPLPEEELALWEGAKA